MKNFFFGLVIGVFLCGLAAYVALPSIQQTSYNNGVEEGNKKGLATGTEKGIADGIAQEKAAQQHQRDSVNAIQQKQMAAQKAVARRKVMIKPVQNWHVIDDKIGDPIMDTVVKGKK